MILVTLNDQGTVGLQARTTGDLRIMRGLRYVRCSGRVGATFWTYLPDLKRDVPAGRLQWADQLVHRLRTLKGVVDRREQGDDAEVRAVFSQEITPYGFQYRGIHAALTVKRILIADDTGLGKTLQTIGTMLVAFARQEIQRAVLVVPAPLKRQWYDEIYAFARHAPDPIVIAQGPPEHRRHLYRRGWRVLLVNPELVRIDYDELRRISGTVGFVALDEASCIRNSESEIASAMRLLWTQARYRLALTATPVENKLADLFSVFDFVDRRVFLSRRYAEQRYILWRKRKLAVRNRKGRMVRITKEEPRCYRNLNEVHAKIRPCYIRRRVADVGLEMPGLVVQWETLELPPKQRKLYAAVRERVVEQLSRLKLRGAALTVPLQGLRQVCNTTALVQKGDLKPAQVKVDRLIQLLDTELAGEQVLIFTDYERFVRHLMGCLRRYQPVSFTGTMQQRERERSIAAFQQGTRRILIATKAGERGLNLQNAAVVVNMDLPFNPAAIKQRLGRVRRLKSKHQTVRMINMIAVDTVEEHLILKKIYAKRQLFEGIFDKDELSEADPLEHMAAGDLRKLL